MMLRIALIAALAPFVVACASSEETTRSTDATGVVDLRREHLEATISEGWLNLRTLQLNAATETPEPEDLFVRGLVTGWRFEPTGEIEGQEKAPDETEGEAVWLRLSDRTLHARVAGEGPPAGAVIAGTYFRATELFYPRDRQILRTASPATP